MVRLNNLNSKPKLGMIMLLYMLGVYMGAIDMGIITPAGTVIQAGLGVEGKLGRKYSIYPSVL